MKEEQLNFEQLLSKVQEIARELERGDLSLEEALKKFEQGSRLLHLARKRLNEAKKRLQVLMEDGDMQELDPDEFLSSEKKEN